jgi:site-specific DNA-cytosine methylase
MDLGVKAFFGPDTTTEWFIEREAHPRKVLALRFPGVPVHKDITTVDHSQLAPIDILIGGPPCTDLSVAGKGAGLHGEKSRLFFDMVSIAKSLQPRYVMIENSSVLLNKWRGTVEGAFADAGYGVTWARLSAAHIGAPHLRWRCFLLAKLGTQHKGVCFPPALPTLTQWPTPSAGNFNDNDDIDDYLARRARVKESAQNGNGFGVQLAAGVRMTSGVIESGRARWATPAASDVDGSRTLPAGTTPGGIKPNGKKAMIGLPNMVERRWATPAARHHKDSGHEPSTQQRNSPSLPAESVIGTIDKSKRLSPAWVETLQGLPVNWTALEGELDPRPWPAHRVDGMWGDSPQHAHEPPRLCDPSDVPNRRARLKALGNLNPPQVYTRALEMLLEGPRQGVLFG